MAFFGVFGGQLFGCSVAALGYVHILFRCIWSPIADHYLLITNHSFSYRPGVGRGGGEGRDLGVGVGLGTGVDVGLGVGVTLGVGVELGVVVGVGLGLGVIVGVGVGPAKSST